jgi:hypothetical protein
MKCTTSLVLQLTLFALAPAVAGQHPPLIGVKIYDVAGEPSHLIDQWQRLGIDTAFVSVDLAKAGALIPKLQSEDRRTSSPRPPSSSMPSATAPIEMLENGWVAHTATGIPGIPGARWVSRSFLDTVPEWEPADPSLCDL